MIYGQDETAIDKKHHPGYIKYPRFPLGK